MKKKLLIVLSLLYFLNISSQLKIKSNSNNLTLIGRIKLLGDINGSLIYFKDKNMYMLSFLNRVYDYKYESFWMNEQSKNELYQLIIEELPKKEKNKIIEIELEDNRVLSLEMHKKRASLNIWDGYKWYKTYWYKLRLLNSLFNKDKGRIYTKADGTIYIE
ncbi:MAG: hypothetical protein CL851_00180 [Crocinitomicaceae bacterium]|nr:hypothetical protein [Crocinitomicaceae bacterium]|tara:strand:+ start:207 stop:689 length:483 start_codon:yes stop_codon:yes gene_type:complete